MTDLIISPQTTPLRGHVPLPSDKSITHRALLCAAIADGESRIRADAMGGDNKATLTALRQLGVSIEERDGAIVVLGKGLHSLSAPTQPLDCGNSGTSMRLLAGLLAAQPFASQLVGDASLSKRPMSRIAVPLRKRGARIEGRLVAERPGETLPPLVIGPLPPPNVLCEVEVRLEIASAQVKSALLLSGLYAAGDTVVVEPLLSRDHTERMLSALGVPLTTMGATVRLDAGRFGGRLAPFELNVPGDLSAAAFVLAACAMVPQSRVSMARSGINPTRTGYLDALRTMGADLRIQALGEELGEPIAHLELVQSELSGVGLGGELLLRSIDEVPVLAALAATAHGVTTIRDARELRVKESDRLAAMARVLGAFGVTCEEVPDGLTIVGKAGQTLRASSVGAEHDHRIAMSAALLGLRADGPTRVRDVDAISTSFPRFVATLRALGARIDVVDSET